MRIGVITFSNSRDNYGQILQIWAFQKYMKNLGHDPFLIRYIDTPLPDTTGFKWDNIIKYLTKFPTYLKWFLNRKSEINRQRSYHSLADLNKRDFQGFIEKHINISEPYDAHTLHENPPYADAFVCGSDQIWGGEDAYYLSFAPDSVLKIAYAPSLGGITTFSTEKEDRIRALILRIDRIGMREQSGVEVCHRLGRKDAIKVVDPTLLLSSSDYLTLSHDVTVPKERYAFVYLLGNPTAIGIKEIFAENKRNGLKTIYVASQGRADNFPKIDATIPEWIALIKNAEVVYTNSFHCVVFCLLFHKNFIAIPLINGYERMNTRIEELLNSSNLNERFTSDLSKVNKMTEEDFKTFDRYRLHEETKSRKFLNI